MKGSCGIKKLYGGAERGYGGAGRICPQNSIKINKFPQVIFIVIL